MSIEQQLKAALGVRDPGDAFADEVMSRLATQPVAQRPRWRVPVALAASLLVACTGLWLFSVHRERQHGDEAQQLLLALQITSEQLNGVQQRLHRLNHEENGS